MQSVRSTQQWSFEGDLPAFLHTTIVFEKNGDYFICYSQERQPSLDAESINALTPQMIPKDHIWPLYEKNLTICNNPTNHNVYIKQPRLTAYNNTSALAKLVLQEARVCEILMQNPHPNIAEYLGCCIQNDRIVGLCFPRYAETAEERKRRGFSIDKKLFLGQIKAAVAHLQALNLAHNDIKASNIMFSTESSEHAVLVDFDSCAMKDEPLPAKRGLPDALGIEELANFLS